MTYFESFKKLSELCDSSTQVKFITPKNRNHVLYLGVVAGLCSR